MIAAITIMCAIHSYACRSNDARLIANSIDRVTDNTNIKGYLALYSFYESGFSLFPRPVSWDALAGVSCGPWQMPCSYVHSKSIDDQAKTWINWVQQAGLHSVDSDPRRATRRAKIVVKILEKIHGMG